MSTLSNADALRMLDKVFGEQRDNPPPPVAVIEWPSGKFLGWRQPEPRTPPDSPQPQHTRQR